MMSLRRELIRRLSEGWVLAYNGLMKINIAHVAKLANLTLSPDEQTKFEGQLSAVLDYIHKLDELNTTDVEPTSQVTGLENVLRDDKASSSLSQQEALSQAKHTHNGMFVVKGIFDNE